MCLSLPFVARKEFLFSKKKIRFDFDESAEFNSALNAGRKLSYGHQTVVAIMQIQLLLLHLMRTIRRGP